MKKVIALILAAVMLLSMAACTANTPQSTDTAETPAETSGEKAPAAPATEEPSSAPEIQSDLSGFSVDLTGITTIEELEDRIETHLASSIEALTAEWEDLKVEIDTYNKYAESTDRVSAFYETVVSETEQMGIMLYEYAAAYARMILDSDMDNDDKYDACGDLYDCLYEDACDELNDSICEDLLDDMSDYFYNGILEDGEDEVDYSTWYDVVSDEYSQWYDAYSDVYSVYYDTASEIYSFYSDLSGELFSEDMERAEKAYADFLEMIAKEKGLDTGSDTEEAIFDTTLRTADNAKDLETVVEEHVEECVSALWGEWEAFAAEINTYEAYSAHLEEVEDFHTHIENAAAEILVLICDYGVSYAELILQSGEDAKDMYNDFEDVRECLYEDACETVKDEIYEDLLGEIKDYYYDGILQDAKDSISYSDWSDARSDAYNWWSDARSEVYDTWSDTRSELYDFCSDIRSELYSKDLDGANAELADFIETVEKMK